MHSITFMRNVLAITALFMVAACGAPPADSAYFNRGGPESLLDVSSEVVNLNATNETDLKDLSAWIEKDRPTRAELNCDPSEKRCDITRKVLDLHGVPVVAGAGSGQSVTLIYERILARDCNPRYVDHSYNYHHTNHPAFGCAVAANMVQHVTDKQEFISPALSDNPSASRAVNDMRRAYTPRAVIPPYEASQSLVSSSGSQ